MKIPPALFGRLSSLNSFPKPYGFVPHSFLAGSSPPHILGSQKSRLSAGPPADFVVECPVQSLFPAGGFGSAVTVRQSQPEASSRGRGRRRRHGRRGSDRQLHILLSEVGYFQV